MLEHMRSSGVVLSNTSTADLDESGMDLANGDGEQDIHDRIQADTTAHNRSGLPTPSLSTSKTPEVSNEFALPSVLGAALHGDHPLVDIVHGADHNEAVLGYVETDPVSHSPPAEHQRQLQFVESHGPNSTDSSLSLCEARVAGVFHEHGRVSSVHGIAGIMNSTSRERHRENISKIAQKGLAAVADSKARLISNAILQRQREMSLFRQPQVLMDLDGCQSEMAKHLLDLHFNRQHYAYLITYRPAIMDNLANGGGPWLNKLLLNAIFYSSALYSERKCLRADPDDMQSVGLHFYRRFKQLLVDEIDTPSVPTAAALLLTSASLVSQGRSSAGWNLSGTAYRMILDLGCHMTLGPEYQTALNHSEERLHTDLEQEMRRRLYWGAYATDATQALYLGRPCMFASIEARVPLQFLDTFEELEYWQPHTDSSDAIPVGSSYIPQPAYAVSTFTALAKLLQISTRITELYGIQSIKLSSATLLDRKRFIERELEDWKASLPEHMSRDPEGYSTPPPHQLTPHTTCHVLIILLQRAFLEEGHLRRHSDETQKKRGEAVQIHSALMIKRYVSAYRTAFTLRRAPFLLSYAVYSAVTVILRHERLDRGKFTEQISFFWTCLNELHHGCNFGLLKPLAILQDMVHELRYVFGERGLADGEQLHPTFDESAFSISNVVQGSTELALPNVAPNGDNFAFDPWGTNPLGPTREQVTDMSGFLDDQEWNVSQDALYGLFAPPQLYPRW